ncbi:MAG: hypothetical protein BJ554DRAFT_3363 [Olpidium bornovanus]|uniref:Uncharacterized protein n=1 Tax=Olpidium bornovanus TaxID=278681 RepID=A0A8H8A1A5_9FUNG|nr:MAG: hypothetical protein BJ554DRAFT_3363 [Olpidium bornovanus]
MRSSSVPRCLLRALLAFAAVATVVVVDAADLDRAAKRTLGRRYPLYHYEILDNFENQHEDGSTYLVMFRHGAATHTTDQKFLNLYYPFRDDNRAPEYIIERLQWNDPELTEEGVRSAHALAQQFSQLVWPYVLENSEKVVFLASSMARALRTALITVPTRLLEEINAKWIVSDDLRGRNSGFGTAWRRSVELTSYHCPKEIVSSALGDGVQFVHRSHWVTTNSMTSAYANEAVDFSQLSNVDPLRIVPEFSGYGLFDAFGTM